MMSDLIGDYNDLKDIKTKSFQEYLEKRPDKIEITEIETLANQDLINNNPDLNGIK